MARPQEVAILYPWDSDNNVTVPVYVSERRFRTGAGEDPEHQPFKERLVPGRTLRQSLFGQDRLDGGASVDEGTIELQNGDGGLNDLIDYSFAGRRVQRILVEPGQALAQGTTIYDGTMGDLGFSGRNLVIPLRGKEGVLGLPVQSKIYGPHATALSFNEGGGTGDQVELPVEANPVTLNEWTIEAWVRAPRGALAGGNRGGLFQLKDTSAQADFYCYYESSISSTRLGMWTTVTWDGYNLRDGEWHHVAFERRGDTGTIYLDGESVATGDVSGSSPSTAVAGALSVGSSTYEIDAEIGEVRVWSKAQDSDKLKGRRHRALDGDETGLRAYYRLNEGANVLGDGNVAYVFDSASSPAGDGYAAVTGSPEWVVTGESAEGLEGKQKPLACGPVELWEPDLVEARTNTYRASSDAVVGLEVFEGARRLNSNSYFETAATSDGLTIPYDSVLDFGSGDVRTFYIDVTVTDLSNPITQLLQSASGIVDWNWYITQDGALFVKMTSSGSSLIAVSTSDGLIEEGGRYDIRVEQSFGGPMRLFVNGVQQGNVAMATSGNYNPAGSVYVGKNTIGNNVLQGTLWSVGQWSRKFTPSELRDRLHESLTEGESGLELGYQLNEGTGTTALDIGSAGNDGTLQGSWSDAGEYTLTNDYRGCYFSLTRKERAPIRCRCSGWLPTGHAISTLATVLYDAGMQTTGSFSIFGYSRFLDDGSSRYHIDRNNAGTGVGGFYFREDSAGNVHFVVYADGGTVSKQAALTSKRPGDWFAWAAVWDESEGLVSVYIDGETLTSESIAGYSISTPNNVSNIRLLRNSTGGSGGSGFGWVNRALSAGEVDVLRFSYSSIRDDADLIALWPANEDDLSPVYDLGPNEYHSSASIGRVSGPAPATATEKSQWLVLRDENTTVTAADIDTDSVASFEAKANSATVGGLFREESQLQAVSELLRPNGWTTFDENGKWKFGQFWAPNVYSVAQFDGSNDVTVADEVALRVSKESATLWGFSCWLWIDRLPPSGTSVDIVRKPNNYRLQLDTSNGFTWTGLVDTGSGTSSGFDAYSTVTIDETHVGRWLHVATVLATDGKAFRGAIPAVFVDGESGYSSVNSQSESHTGSYEDVTIGEGFVGKIFAPTFWSSHEDGTPYDAGQLAITGRYHLLNGSEAGIGGSWPLVEDSGTSAVNRVSGGNVGTWSSEPLRSPVTTPIVGDYSSTLVSRDTYTRDGLAQTGVITPTAVERVGYRLRSQPYRRSELVGIALESPIVSSEMTRAYDELPKQTPENRVDYLLAEEGALQLTPFSLRADAARALDVLAANYSSSRDVFSAADKVNRFGLLGERVRVDAARRDGTQDWNIPVGGRDFIVTGINYSQRNRRWVLELFG